MVPANGNKSDFVIIGDHTRLSVKASLWFRLRAVVDPNWSYARLKEFAADHDIHNGDTVLVIIDYDHQIIKPK